MEEEQLLSRDRQKVANFLSLAESGTVQAGLTQKQKQQQHEYIMRQRDLYANAAFRAQDKLIPKTSSAYLQNIQEMNQVKVNLENLAVQQKAIGENQQQYLDDVENGRLSKANYVDGANGLADIYSGEANMAIDDFGNLTFEVEGEYKPYSQLASYSLKAIDTANGVLDMLDQVAGSKKQASQAQMGIFNNKIRSIIEGSSRSDVVSLVKDNILPGFENIDIDEELFKTENLDTLKDQVLSTITNAANDINNSIASSPSERSRSSSPPAAPQTGYAKNSNENITNASNAYNSITAANEERVSKLNKLSEKERPNALATMMQDSEADEGQQLDFYGSNDTGSRKGSYYVKSQLFQNEDGSIETGIAFRKNKTGKWQRISKEDFEKEISGTQSAGGDTPDTATTFQPK